jgi:hypothetical protein
MSTVRARRKTVYSILRGVVEILDDALNQIRITWIQDWGT